MIFSILGKRLTMKKIIISAIAILIAFTGMAQSKSQGKGHNKDKSDKYSKHSNKHQDNNKDGRYDRNDDNDDVYRNDNKHNGKYAKNQPAKVRAAFHRDYPNASNVTWTKNSGNWTASFPNGIYRVNATYSSNGQRLNSNTNNRRRTSSRSDGSIWDKILTKQ